ncbi:MAG: fibronectin type III domain-containing protein [Huintestinicola sp.]|uniref:fibronectin type III domain-containing protein n=1 Tax=Huintestinicola sp. TaxID=2981661 RepID=UPI003EFD9A5A
MDFNTQRKIVRRLEEAGKNPLLFLPCLIAKYAVILFMSVCRSVDMALSDKEGNFLGIKRKPKAKKAYGDMPETDFFTSKKPARRPSLPFRPLWQRAMSLLLACAFISMSAEISAAADDVTLQKYVAEAKQLITAAEIQPLRSSVYEADLYKNYKDNPTYALQIENGAFNGMPNLTTITLGYSDNMSIGANNFVNLAPDAAVYIRTDSKTDYEAAAAQISSTEVSKIWDCNGQTYSEIPDDIPVLTAYSGVGKVILKWDNITPEPDGYAIYTYSNGKYNPKPTIFSTAKATEGDNTRTRCSVELSGSSGKSQIYAVRAFRNLTSSDYDGDGTNDVNVPLYSRKFARSESAAPLTAGKPDISTTMSNKTATVNISMPAKASEPSYILLYCKDEGETFYSPRLKITPSQMTNGAYSFEDPVPFEGVGVRSYVAVAYYDVLNRDGSLLTNQYVYPEKDTSTAEYTTTRSAEKKITDAVLNSPTNLNAALSSDKTMWMLTWDRPDGTSSFDVYYSVYANGRPVIAETSRYLQDFAKINVNDPAITQGENVEFTVTAHADGMTSGAPAKITVEINSSNSVILNSVKGGNQKAVINFTSHPGTKLYTIFYTHTDENGVERTESIKVSESDCQKSGKNLTYPLTGLENDVEYSIYVASDAATALYSSVIKKVTPSPAPQPPEKVYVKPLENSAVVSWDIVYKEGTSEPVDGYLVRIVRESGQTVVPEEKVVGLTEFTPKQKLENDVNYYAYVKSYVVIGDNPPIESVTETRSDLFTPTVQVDNDMKLTVAPSGKVINISWTAVKGASEYILTRTDPDGIQSDIYKGSKNSYTDSFVNNKTKYTYKVKAVRTVDGKDYVSDYSEEQQGMINFTLAPVQGLIATGGDGCIILKWDKVDGADGYIIQYSPKDADNWTTIGKWGQTTFTHTGLLNGDVYDYRVIPYVMINEIEERSDGYAQKATGRAGINLPAPADFTVTAGDGQITLKWSAVKGAEGYCVYLVAYDGSSYLLDKVTKTTAIHTNLSNNTTFTYKVCAYKYVGDNLVEGDFSVAKSATVGIELNAPTDVTAKAGNEQITITWKKTDGAEGYVVYAYNMAQMSFVPVGIVTSTSFVHTGLIAGREYTYMVAAYKNVNGSVVYSGYSLAVTATPTSSGGTKPTDNSNAEAGDYRLFITGTTPYGMSNSNLISAFAGKGAFNTDIDVRFTLSPDTVTAIQDVLNFYGEGIDSFLIYPMDIAIYVAGTNTKATINPGYYMTLTIPVPDELLPYSEHISVVHVSDLGQLEILPSIHVNVGGVDCMQFTANSFSPYAFVVYLPEIGEDTSAGTPAAAQGTAQTSTSGQSAVFTFRNTYLPEIYRRRARNKVYRIVNR